MRKTKYDRACMHDVTTPFLRMVGPALVRSAALETGPRVQSHLTLGDDECGHDLKVTKKK